MRNRSSRLAMVSPFIFLFSFVLVQLIPSSASARAETPPGNYTRLEPISTLKIVASSEAYPGGRHEAGNLIDGNLQTEYSSNNKGTSTFVEFDLGGAKSVVAFRHVERNDRATIGESELSFLDENGQSIATYPVMHVNQRSAVTFFELPSPVTAQRVRWRVTRLGAGLRTVGGAEIVFFTVGKSDPAPTATKVDAKPLDMLERKDGTLVEPLNVTLDYPYLQPVDATVQIAGVAPVPVRLKPGSQTLQISLPETILPRKRAAATPSVFSSSPMQGDESLLPIKIAVAGQTVASSTALLKPVRHLEIFLLPHSHNDIGYTALQADVEQKQNSNIEAGLRLAQATANYPEGARFKWNTEVLWCVDNYLRDVTPEKRAAFIAAVKTGQIGLDALYGNTLTGLCRPEELLNLMGYATRLSQECGVPIESAMISDVPGYTWSTVSAMAQAGVKYFSFAPNYFDRMGGTMKEWQNRPFWWKGPDGRSRVLCWCPSRGYALGHLIGDGEALARFIPSYLVELETNSYPYDITHLRWNVHGDNGSPDEKLADVVRDWNARYAWPRLIISTTAAAFREFEWRYGDKLPEFSGDYTPYWEDGAASSALETAMNRASAERLVQAETLWAMRQPAPFPAGAFQDTWRNILLYSEHTWGAHNSISQPDLPFVTNQWHVKQAFASDAEKESQDLLARALAAPPVESVPGQVDVFNTSSWARTGLVTLAPELSAAGDRVVDERGKIVPSQRLSTGELVFLARDVPPFSAKRFRIEAGACPSSGSARVVGANLSSSEFSIRIDERTGAIASLTSRSLGKDLVDTKAATALNDYFYLPGSDLKGLQRNGVPHIRVKERGPLVASLLIECEAPGCRSLSREVRLVDGLDWVELINTIDKLPIRAKEGLHFGFGFAVPDGQMRLDVGWAVVRPELDQIPAACKNWFSVQRWVDISNDKFGVTWSPVDAPLVEDGALTANLVGSQTDWRAWIQHLKPSETIYSWVMNNHWHTNYRADQEGPTVFRFVLRPHERFSADAAARFGVDCAQPLVVARASGRHPIAPPLALSSDHVLVAAFKPSDDGKARIVRLFGASGKAQKVKLTWAKPAPRQVWLSDLGEQPKTLVHGAVEVPAWGIVTLRAE